MSLINFYKDSQCSFSADEYVKLKKTNMGYGFSTTANKSEATNLRTVVEIFATCAPINIEDEDLHDCKNTHPSLITAKQSS